MEPVNRKLIKILPNNNNQKNPWLNRQQNSNNRQEISKNVLSYTFNTPQSPLGNVL